MNCTPLSIFIFISLSFIYGSLFAGIQQALKFFSPGVFQTFRSLFGLIFCILIFIIKYKWNINNLKTDFSNLKTLPLKIYIYLLFGGIINMGLPSCLITTGLKWVNTASGNLLTPWSSVAGSIFSHFVLPDERFNLNKFFSLLFSIIGVLLTGYPPFRVSKSSTTEDTINLIYGYIFIFIGITSYGVAPTFFRWKLPKLDITFNVIIQLFSCLIFCFIWSLIFDGWSFFYSNTINVSLKGWFWPIFLGFLISAVAIHGYIYLIENIGAFGSTLLPFAQILVGVALGVLFLKEWNKYTTFEIIIILIGMIFLTFSMFFGFKTQNIKKNKEEDIQEEEEEDKKDQPVIEL